MSSVDFDPMMSESELVSLKAFVDMVRRHEMMALEIGSWKGQSTQVIAERIVSSNGKLFCVDTWHGDGNEVTERDAGKYNILQIFLNNMDVLQLRGVVWPMIMKSEIAANIVKDESFDLIFLDADHSYKHVKQDIELWFPKLRKGGIFCGHDFDHDGVGKAVKEAFPNAQTGGENRMWHIRKGG